MHAADRQVGVYDAKTHLAHLLAAVEKGESITITRHGKPVARLVPVEPRRRRSVDEVIEEMQKDRTNRKLDGLSIREMIDAGRRY